MLSINILNFLCIDCPFSLTGIAELESKSAEFKEKLAVTKAETKESESLVKAHKQQLSAWNKEISTKVGCTPCGDIILNLPVRFI